MQIGMFMTMPAPEPRPAAEILSRGIELAVARRMNLFTGVLEPISTLINIRERYPDLAPRLAGLRIGTQRPVYVAQSEAEAHIEEMPA